MSSDRTQHQSNDELQKARELSLESTQPPSQIPGYRLQQFIGSGAFGEVWSGTDLKTGRRVAVKFYTRRTQADVQLLAQEVEKLVALSADSRYVVQLFDVGWEANPPYYVMDYIEQGSLEDRIKKNKGLPTSEALDLFQEIATGMMQLHGKGILHCDLKPGNVLLDQNGKPRVADFGQSRLSTDETPALGTLFYMAPEQADMSAIPDSGWDVYGLGAILYCMLTGKPPYYSDELTKSIESANDISDRLARYRNALLKSPPPSEHRKVPGVDRMLADLIDRCIAANPKKRFTSVQSILLALSQRETAQARRPLMMLGLIGPLLLIGVMFAFGFSAFNHAISRAKEAVTDKAYDSSQFAAKLAARSASERIDEYFRVVSQLARNENFVSDFQRVATSDELKQMRIQLANPANNYKNGVESKAEIGRIRAAFNTHPIRKALQKYLTDRMFDSNGDYPPAASWFVSDRFGNQVASVFRSENHTLGCNYAYRTYFTGRDKDLSGAAREKLADISLPALESREIIDRPHLSAVFQSQQSKTWKVAFSAPIMENNQPIGIVAVTVDLGNLIEFDETEGQYTMLVDSRSGEHEGAILEHPAFSEALKQQSELPHDLAVTKIDVAEAIAGTSLFSDPVGQTELGNQLGFGQQSLVAAAPVKMEKINRIKIIRNDKDLSDKIKRQETGLDVLAVQNYQYVLSDVRTLESQLTQIGIWAGVLLVVVALGMWAFVNRMLRDSRKRLSGVFSPQTEAPRTNSMPTVPDRANDLTAPFTGGSKKS